MDEPNKENVDSVPKESRPVPTGFGPVDAFNEAIWRSPIAAGAVMLGAEMVGVFGCYGAILALGIPVSAEFALAFAISRPIRKIRLPVEILVAEGMARAVPVLTKARISRLLAVMTPGKEALKLEDKISAGLIKAKISDLWNFQGGVSAWMERTFVLSMFFTNRYGVCFQLASRIVGVVVIALLYALVSAGVDVQGFLEARGLGGLGSAAGHWALAVVAASVVYPATLAATGYAALWVINQVSTKV